MQSHWRAFLVVASVWLEQNKLLVIFTLCYEALITVNSDWDMYSSWSQWSGPWFADIEEEVVDLTPWYKAPYFLPVLNFIIVGEPAQYARNICKLINGLSRNWLQRHNCIGSIVTGLPLTCYGNNQIAVDRSCRGSWSWCTSWTVSQSTLILYDDGCQSHRALLRH